MIQMGTILQVADNTGAKKIACIRMLGGSTAVATGRISSSTTTQPFSSTTRVSRWEPADSVR